MLQPNPLPCKFIVTVALPAFSKNGSFRVFVLYGEAPEAVIVSPERTMSTFCVEEMGDDSSLWTGPEYGEGVSDGTAVHPLMDIQTINVMINRNDTMILPIFNTDIIWICP
jgi:hypothetical protein